MKNLLIIPLAILLFSCLEETKTGPDKKYDLVFNELASTWDEAMPLENLYG